MTSVAELAPDTVAEGVYAVARKQRLRTKSGAAYLALELVDASGRIDARVWNDVELLDGRFAEGDSIRVLGRVERFRDKLQLGVRTLEPAAESEVAALIPAMKRDKDELDGFLEFLAAEVSHAGLRAVVDRFVGDAAIRARLRELPATHDGHHAYAGGLLEHTVGVATLCRETAQLHPRLRSDLLLAPGLLPHLLLAAAPPPARGQTHYGVAPPLFRPTQEGALLGHVHLGLRLVEERADALDLAVRAELLHAIGSHHDARAARTAEAAVLYHANQLDAIAATRPVET